MKKSWRRSRADFADGHLPEGAIFQDAPLGPEMVVVAAGEFLMGSGEAEAQFEGDNQAYSDEVVPGQGKRRMRIARRFALGRYLVTLEEYHAFLAATGRRSGLGGGRRPVVNITWQDAQNYCAWLNLTTGLGDEFGYRLPSESEWEYACRAGTNTSRWWGDDWDPTKANGNRSFEDGKTSPVGHYPPNPWGLHDMIGNIDEWCADHYADNISELPINGAPFFEIGATELSFRILRGGSRVSNPPDLRSAHRDSYPPENSTGGIGFRVARTLLPPSS